MHHLAGKLTVSASRQYQGNNVKLLGEAGFLVMCTSTNMCSSLIHKPWVDVANGSKCQKGIYAHCIPVIIDLFLFFVFFFSIFVSPHLGCIILLK